ncbi:MAG: hypothetical protein K5786_01315 [Treponema sp.]|nr:hypothetical protein [Treponema sp.]
MKRLTKLSLLITTLFLALPLAAQEEESTKTSPWSFSISTDFAYYPLSAPIVSENTHFSTFTGPYSGLEGRTTAHAYYTIPTPIGNNPLTAGDNITLEGYFELSPVSIKPGLSVSFTPIAFLVFNAGAEIGTGWNLLGIEGMGSWDASTESHYASLTPFASWYHHFWFQGTFQFDTGALIPGDWSHVVMLASYKVEHIGITGCANQELWCWQGSSNQVNGWKYYSNAILAYQMPLFIKRAGVLAEFSGYYSDDVYEFGSAYDGNFMTVDISPLAQFQLGQNDELSLLFNFSSRRGYSAEYEGSYSETFLSTISREWYFKRIALSWTHNF